MFRFSTPINVGSQFHLPFNRCGIPITPLSEPSVLTAIPPYVHPLQDLVSSLVHRPVSGSDTIYNCPSYCSLWKSFHILIKNASFSPQLLWDLTSHLPTRGFHILIRNASSTPLRI